jgi:hypothetical protein
VVKITGIDSLRKRLEGLKDKYVKPGEDKSVVVGYTARYAVWVHERQAKHAPGKQWKYLEEPARRLSDGYLGLLIRDAMKGGATLIQALYIAGLRLQRASQEIVPIDTGNLRGSAFTAKESDLQAVMAASEETMLKRMQKQGEQRAKKSAKKKVGIAKKKAAKAAKVAKVKTKKSAKKMRKSRQSLVKDMAKMRKSAKARSAKASAKKSVVKKAMVKKSRTKKA